MTSSPTFGMTPKHRQSPVRASAQPVPPGARTAGPFARRLLAFGALSAQELEIVGALQKDRRKVPERLDISTLGKPVDGCFIVYDGWLVQAGTMLDGRRQIVRFILPGDIIGLNRELNASPEYSFVTITPAQIAWVPGDELRRQRERHQGLRMRLRDFKAHTVLLLHNQILRLGRMSAYERLAHLICEICSRLRDIDLVTERRYDFPITQDDLADALGLTPVHINRTLQRLRADGLIELKSKRLTVLKPDLLQQLAEFKILASMMDPL